MAEFLIRHKTTGELVTVAGDVPLDVDGLAPVGLYTAYVLSPPAVADLELQKPYVLGSPTVLPEQKVGIAIPPVDFGPFMSGTGTWSLQTEPGWGSIDDVTGVLTGTPNDDGEATFTVRLTHATAGFAEIVYSFDVAPGVPLNTSIPTIQIAAPHVGQNAVALNGVWEDADTFTYAWQRDGSPIGGAVDLFYVLVDADEGHDIRAAVTATNETGSTLAYSAAITVTYAPPVAAGGVVEVTFEEDTGDQTLAMSNYVTVAADADLSSVTWSLDVPVVGYSINSGTGVLTISTTDEGTDELVTVVATNSGGSTQQDVSVTIDAAEPTYVPLTIVADGLACFTYTNKPQSDTKQFSLFIDMRDLNGLKHFAPAGNGLFSVWGRIDVWIDTVGKLHFTAARALSSYFIKWQSNATIEAAGAGRLHIKANLATETLVFSLNETPIAGTYLDGTDPGSTDWTVENFIFNRNALAFLALAQGTGGVVSAVARDLKVRAIALCVGSTTEASAYRSGSLDVDPLTVGTPLVVVHGGATEWNGTVNRVVGGIGNPVRQGTFFVEGGTPNAPVYIGNLASPTDLTVGVAMSEINLLRFFIGWGITSAKTTGPNWLTVTNNLISEGGTNVPDVPGTNIPVAIDVMNGGGTYSLQFPVDVAPAPTAPAYLNTFVPQIVPWGVAGTCSTIEHFDGGGSGLTMSLVAPPAGFTINAASGLVSWTDLVEPAIYSVSVRATNSVGNATGVLAVHIGLVWQTTFVLTPGAGNQVINLSPLVSASDYVDVAFACDVAIPAVPDVVTAGYIALYEGSGTSPTAREYGKFMPTPPDTTVTIKKDDTGYQSGVIQVWRGVHPTTPLDVAIPTANVVGTDQFTITPPPITTSTAKALISISGWRDDDDTAPGATAPSGYSNILAADTGRAQVNADGSTVLKATKLKAAAGLETPGNFTTSLADASHARTFALRSAIHVGGGGDPLDGILSPQVYEGFGKNATGGLGAAWVPVTNLANSTAAGTFRNAVEIQLGGNVVTAAPINIFSAVQGLTTLPDNYSVARGNFSYFNAAPGPGHLFIVGRLRFHRGNNIIISGLRHYGNNMASVGGPGDSGDNFTTGPNNDADPGAYHQRDIVWYRCSGLYSRDECTGGVAHGDAADDVIGTFGMCDVRRWTMQQCLLARGAAPSHRFALYWGGGFHEATALRNLWFNFEGRMPMSEDQNEWLEFLNNFCYGGQSGQPMARYDGGGAGNISTTILEGNHWRLGPGCANTAQEVCQLDANTTYMFVDNVADSKAGKASPMLEFGDGTKVGTPPFTRSGASIMALNYNSTTKVSAVSAYMTTQNVGSWTYGANGNPGGGNSIENSVTAAAVAGVETYQQGTTAGPYPPFDSAVYPAHDGTFLSNTYKTVYGLGPSVGMADSITDSGPFQGLQHGHRMIEFLRYYGPTMPA